MMQYLFINIRESPETIDTVAYQYYQSQTIDKVIYEYDLSQTIDDSVYLD